MRKCARRLTVIALTGCASLAIAGCKSGGDAPVFTSVNTMCTSTTRYHATDAQIAAFKADQGFWEGLVNWLAGFNKTRDAECLKPAPGL